MTSVVSRRRFICSDDRMTPESEMTGLDDEGNPTMVGVKDWVGEPRGGVFDAGVTVGSDGVVAGVMLEGAEGWWKTS